MDSGSGPETKRTCVLVVLCLCFIAISVVSRNKHVAHVNLVEIPDGKKQLEDSSCNLDFASASLQQYQQYKRMVKSLPFLVTGSLQQLIPDFSVNVSIHDYKHMAKLYITINETGNTNGGSSFKIHFASTEFLAAYAIRDFFNGTYYGCYVVPKHCFTVTVQVLFLSFTAYLDKAPCPLTNNTIYKTSWCPAQNITVPHGNVKQNHICKTLTRNTYKSGLWVLDENWSEEQQNLEFTTKSSDFGKIKLSCLRHMFTPQSRKWIWKDRRQNCVFSRNSLVERWNECLNRYSSLHFFGDSHTGGLFNYIVETLGAMYTSKKNKKRTRIWGKLRLHGVTFNDKVATALMNFTKYIIPDFKKLKLRFKRSEDIQGNNRTLGTEASTLRDPVTKNDSKSDGGGQNKMAVLFGFGSWELQIHNLSSYFDTFDIIRETVVAMVKASKMADIRWIYMTHPSVWDNSECFCSSLNLRKTIPNMFSAAVINAFTIAEFKKAGLEFDVFDYYTFTSHRNNEVVDAVHYLLEAVKYQGRLWYGPVGTAAVDVLLTQLCPNV